VHILSAVLHLVKYLLEIAHIGSERVLHYHLLIFFLVRMEAFVDHLHATQFLNVRFLIQVFYQLAYFQVLFMDVSDN